MNACRAGIYLFVASHQADNSRLYATMFYSQFGEDAKLARIFGNRLGICVDVGANDGVLGSNSLFFEQQGWTCVLIEPNPALCDKLRRTRTGLIHECAVSDKAGDVTLHIVEGTQGADGMSTASADPSDHVRFRELGFTSVPRIVKCMTLDSVLDVSRLNAPIDFVSIDVEGLELQVLRGFSLDRWRPRVLLIEDNSSLRDDSVARHLKSTGYTRFHRTGVNDWYGRTEDAELINLASRMRVFALLMLVPLTRKLRQLPRDSALRSTLRLIPGIALLHRKLPF